MKKFLVLFLVLAVSAALFAGGGGQSAPSGGGGAAQKEIRVVIANQPYYDVVKPLIPEFEKQSGIRVIMEQLQEAQLTQKLTTEFATGSSSIDVFATRPLQEALLFNKNGWYAPLTSYDFSDFPPSTVELGVKDGKPHVVPTVTEWQVLYYRKDLFNAAGLKVPTNLAELENAAKVLNKDGIAGFGSRGAGPAAVTQMSSYIYNHGGRYLEKNTAVFDKPDAMEAIRYYGRMLGNYGPQGITAMSWEHLMPVFQAGRVAMFTDASSMCGQVYDPAKTQIPAANIGVAKLPAGPKGDSPYIVVAWGMAISSKTRDMDSSMKFINWATGKEMALTALLSGVTVARKSAWENPQIQGKVNPGLIETMQQTSAIGFPLDRPWMTSVVKARDLIGEVIIESINTKGASPRLQALATEKAKEVDELLKADGEYGK